MPGVSTPPATVTAPQPTRFEYEMGYHRAVVERLPDGVLWQVSIASSLVGQMETLIYDDEQLAHDGAKVYLQGVYDAEMAVRATFYEAYQAAYGRESAPEEHGPAWVDPTPPPPA